MLYCENILSKVSRAISLKDYHAIGLKNLEFHRLITEATHNPVFMLTMDYILEFIPDFKKSFFTPDVEMCTKVVNDHRAIYNSLKEGNTQEAEARMLSHLKYLEDYQMDEKL